MSITPLPEAQGLQQVITSEIKALMGRYGVTQVQLASLLDLTPSQLSKRLRGVPTFDVLEIAQIAEVFGVSVAQLFGEMTIPRPVEPSGGDGAEDGTRTRNILLGRQRL